MLLCLFLGNLFADRRVGDFEATPLPSRLSVPRWNWVFVVIAMAASLVGPGYAAIVMNNTKWAGEAHLSAPTVAAPWQQQADPVPAWRPVFNGPSAELSQTFGDGKDDVGLYVAYYPAQGQGAEVIYHANRMANDEQWKRMETRRMMLNVDGKPMQVRLERMQGSPGPKRVAAYWYWIAGRFTSDPIEAKLFQIAGALTSGYRSAAAIAVTVVETDDTDRNKAALQRFLDATPNLNTYLTNLAKAR